MVAHVKTTFYIGAIRFNAKLYYITYNYMEIFISCNSMRPCSFFTHKIDDARFKL